MSLPRRPNVAIQDIVLLSTILASSSTDLLRLIFVKHLFFFFSFHIREFFHSTITSQSMFFTITQIVFTERHSSLWMKRFFGWTYELSNRMWNVLFPSREIQTFDAVIMCIVENFKNEQTFSQRERRLYSNILLSVALIMPAEKKKFDA